MQSDPETLLINPSLANRMKFSSKKCNSPEIFYSFLSIPNETPLSKLN